MPSVLDGPVCFYATVKMVRVDNVTATDITFSSRSSANEYESFTVPLTELLCEPPTDAPTPVPLTPGAIGNLYLSKNGWKQTSAGGNTLYKAGDPNYVLFKWPLCKPYRLLAYLRVKPTKIVVDGTNLATRSAVSIDLLGSDAAPAQDIDWRAAAPITVRLTAAGTATYGQDTLMIWPKRIMVDAASLQKPHISANLDILDVAFGDFIQRLTWTERGAPIDLKLSTSGFGLFKVTPHPIVYFASGLRVTYPEALLAECALLDDVTENDVREHVRLTRERVAELLKASNKKKTPAAKRTTTSRRSGASDRRAPRPRTRAGRS